MRLRYSPTSPFVRKVMVTAYEKGLETSLDLIPTNVWDPDTDISSDNPLGKVPALLLSNGDTLYDSIVICEYLDSLEPAPRLFPITGPERWQALRQHALANGAIESGVSVLLEKRRPPQQQSGEWITRQLSKIKLALNALEEDAPELGEDVTIAHITIGCCLEWLEFRSVDASWRTGRPHLTRWHRDFSLRRSMYETTPKEI